MLRNPRSLVLRTDITNRSEDKEHNPRSPSARAPAFAPVLPPIVSLPTIEITTPSGQTQAPAPRVVVHSPTSPQSPNRGADWKEKEAELDRQFSFPAKEMPLQPPPAYASTVTPSANGSNLSTRQRRLNLPKLNPHARVSSINPAKSPIDPRRWHEKRRNIAYISGVSFTILIITLILNYVYVLPMIRDHHEENTSDIQIAKVLEGYWNMTSLKLETVAAEDPTVIDACAAKETEFGRCVDNRWLESGAGANFNFDLKQNDDGTFTGQFGEGIFELDSSTEVILKPSRYGLMSNWVYTNGDVTGKLSADGCIYSRAVLFLVTFENGSPTYKITERMMVAPDGDCILPQGIRDDSCQCTFIGKRPLPSKRRR